MKITSFFKILNRKIEKYDKLASNFFEKPQPIVVVWVEDFTENAVDKDEFNS